MPSPPDPKAEVLEGLVQRVTYEDERSGFRVLRLAVQGLDAPVSVVGRMQRLTPGTQVRVGGRYETDPRHGRQFRAQTVLVIEPDTAEGITKYLGSGLVPGIGQALAQRIVAHFGAQTLEILDRNPERMSEVPGLGRQRVAALAKAWTEQRVVRDVMVFLQGHGVSPNLAARVYRRYGNDTIRLVSENPYRLALEVWGVGFLKADEIARTMGIASDAPERLRAAVLHVLDQSAERGHVFLPRPVLVDEAQRIVEVSTERVEQAVDEVCASKEARQELLEDIGPSVYSSRRYIEEAGLSHAIARLSKASVQKLEGADKAIAQFEEHSSTTLAPAQRQAVYQASDVSVMVITGGPGVGKTTLVRALIELYDQAHLIVGLAAPTGRASRRMAEATGREASTIHRLLEYDPRKGTFARDENNPLSLDVLIVDESSMLDLTLAFALLRALATGTRLVLVGDVDQLPSIGAGAVLRDVIESDQVPCVRLTEIFRQAAQSRIVHNAHRIREGRLPEGTPAGDKSGDFYLVAARDAQEAAERVLLMVAERIPKQFGVDPRRQIQVLTPMHKGPVGSDALNHALQERLNPEGQALTLGHRTYRVGDKVMQLRNDYGRDIYNGDVGFVKAIDPQQARLVVELEGRDVLYDNTQLDELTLAYACSVHKSQGSEYPVVVMPLVTSHFIMLSRNLLYTAVTRAKRLVVLIADRKALGWAVAEARREERYSYLFRRLREACR